MKESTQISQRLLKSFLMLLLILAISLYPVYAMSQQCEYVYDSKGDIVADAYVIDGVTGLFFEQKRATRILATISEYEIIVKKTNLQEEKIKILTDSLQDARSQADFWKKSYEAAMQTLKSIKDSAKFYSSDVAIFAYGFIAASLAYGYWSYTDK